MPPHPGNFSALGLLSTDMVYYDSRSSYVILSPQTAGDIGAVYEDMEQRLRARLPQVDPADITVLRTLDGRLYGQSWETPFIELPEGPVTGDGVVALIERFHEEYARRNGRSFPQIPVQGVTYRVQLIVASEKVEYRPQEAAAEPAAVPRRP